MKLSEIIAAKENGEIIERQAQDGSWEETNFNASFRFYERLALEGKLRIKPKTLSINGIEFPEPLKEAPSDATRYYVPNTLYPEEQGWFVWCSDSFDYRMLSNGLIHLTREAAQQHLNAILSVSKREENDVR